MDYTCACVRTHAEMNSVCPYNQTGDWPMYCANLSVGCKWEKSFDALGSKKSLGLGILKESIVGSLPDVEITGKEIHSYRPLKPSKVDWSCALILCEVQMERDP